MLGLYAFSTQYLRTSLMLPKVFKTIQIDMLLKKENNRLLVEGGTPADQLLLDARAHQDIVR